MVRINIGGFELDSNKLPKEGLDYSNFSEQAQDALSVFDTDSKKGHLSLNELRKAISFFFSEDGAIENGTDSNGNKTITYHKKEGQIDKFEYEKTVKNFKEKFIISSGAKKYDKEIKDIENSRSYVYATRTTINRALNVLINKYKKEHNGAMPSDDYINIAKSELEAKYLPHAVNNLDMKVAIAEIYYAIKANELGLKVFDSELQIYQDNNSNYYIHTSNGKFQRCNKKGHYNVKKSLNDKGQKALIKYNHDCPISIKALNFENKIYTNCDYAAKVLGLEKMS